MERQGKANRIWGSSSPSPSRNGSREQDLADMKTFFKSFFSAKKALENLAGFLSLSHQQGKLSQLASYDLVLLLLFCFYFIYLRDRERAQRESEKREADTLLSREPRVGLEPKKADT